MKKNFPFGILQLITGICLIILSFLLKAIIAKSIGGVFIGVGGGLSGLGIIRLITNHIESSNPAIKRAKEIENKDERNTMIRNRAKAKAGDITQWLIIAIAYVTILISAPLWVTSFVVAVYVLYNLTIVFLINKYQKEM
ncbi:MAG: hypothetical protein K0R50_4211 [Eubacterium sp.]|nr:hypothetical protein [Eubacterium sp.]